MFRYRFAVPLAALLLIAIRAPLSSQASLKKLLAIGDVRGGYQHDSVSHALATIERLGRDISTKRAALTEA